MFPPISEFLKQPPGSFTVYLAPDGDVSGIMRRISAYAPKVQAEVTSRQVVVFDPKDNAVYKGVWATVVQSSLVARKAVQEVAA